MRVVRSAVLSLFVPMVLFRTVSVGAAPSGVTPHATASQATKVTFDTSDSRFTRGVDNQGWYSNRVDTRNQNPNYLVGRCCFDDGNHETRDFFTFDLTDLTAHVVGASLELPDAPRRDQAPLGQTLRFYEVTTPARRLNLNNGADEATFFDLGHGKRFGSFVVRRLDSPGVRTFELNARAMHAINEARGGFFSVGGRLVNMPANTAPFLFGGTTNAGRQRLIVQTG